MSSFTQFRCVLSTVSVHACAHAHILKLNVDTGCFPWLLSTLVLKGLSLTQLTWLSNKLQESSCPCLPALGFQACAVSLAAGDDLGSHTCTANTAVPDPSLGPKENTVFMFPVPFFPDSAGHPEPGLWKRWANALLLSYTQPKGVFHLLIILFEMGHTEYDFAVWHKSTVCLRPFTLTATISRLPYKLNTMYPRLASIAPSLLPEDQDYMYVPLCSPYRTGHWVTKLHCLHSRC